MMVSTILTIITFIILGVSLVCFLLKSEAAKKIGYVLLFLTIILLAIHPFIRSSNEVYDSQVVKKLKSGEFFVVNGQKLNAPEDAKSQFGQDILALKANNYKKNGYYVEIGVMDGQASNNTALLDNKYDWRGVCIDPFMKNMGERTCKQVYSALGKKAGKANFRGLGSGFGGLDEFSTSSIHNNMWKDKVKDMSTTEVNVETPDTVLRDVEAPPVIDYLSLDVEGAEMDVLESFPFHKHCVRFMTVETNQDKNKLRKMKDLLEPMGYVHKGSIGPDIDQIFTNECA